MEVHSTMKRTACLVILFTLLALPARAFDNFTYTSARALSMGNAFTGLADDESAIFYNAAGLAYIQGQQVGVSGLYQDYSWDYTSTSSIISPNQSERGFSLFYLREGLAVSFSLMGEGWWDEMTFRGSIYDPTETYTVKPVFYERYLTASYARVVFEGFSLGVTGKYINTDDPFDFYETKNGFTLDAGALYTLLENLSVGLSIANIVYSEIDFSIPDDFGQRAFPDKLPRNVSLGVAYRPRSDIVIVADVQDLFEDGVKDVLYETYYTAKRSYHIGCEWRALEGLSLRAGYFYDQRISDHPDFFNRTYEYDPYHNVTFGAGFMYRNFCVDAGAHLDDRRSKMEDHPLELSGTTLAGFATVSLAF